jgi:uncharacterized damage-inducible protein DinB
MSEKSLGKIYLHELETEAASTRKCLERVPESLFGYKPHETSMNMGYMALIVAAIPNWITHTIKDSEIDFATYKPFQPKTTAELVKYFEDNLAEAKETLGKVTDEELTKMFYLKNNGVTLASSRKDESISSSINHLVHHRGQLTVYMRMNGIPVPSIYGPSADEKSF